VVMALGALVWVRRRGSNQRLRLLAVLVGLLPVLQTIILLKENGYWFRGLNFPLADVIHLLVGALCVCAMYLLDLEISDRRKNRHAPAPDGA
jgi:heme A synthase